MEKPTDCPVSTDGRRDYDLTERIVRQMQESHLHVFATHVSSSLPDALKTGDAEHDERSGLFVSLTMLTDGLRGFLILVHAVREYDAAYEMTELLSEVAPPGTFVVRGACMSTGDPCERPRTLRLRDPAGVRRRIERAYDEAFAGAARIDHAAFFEGFAPFGYHVRSERELREEIL